MNYARQREYLSLQYYFLSYTPSPLSFPSLSPSLSPLSPPPLSSSILSNINVINNDIKDMSQLIQFHIQRLENYERENVIWNSNELKRNNFIETKKKKKKREFYSKHNKFHM